MKYLPSALLLLLLASATNVLAQSKADEDAVRRLPQDFCDAWAKHDGHVLAKIMADDVDFVTVATTYLHGRTLQRLHAQSD
jgi:ketosteroid isomerase-like protein